MLRNWIQGESRKALAGEGEVVPFALTGASRRRISGQTQRQHLETYGGQDAIDWVMDCVDLYAQTGSNAAYYFHEPLKPGENAGSVKPTPVEQAPQDLVNLFEMPNPYMEYTELLELAIIDLLVAGEFFWLKYKRGNDPASPQYGKPLALYRLSPALVEIILDDDDKPEAVELKVPGSSGTPVRFKPEDIIHVRRPNPHDQWRGLSVISASPMAMDIELAVTEAMRNYYDNGTWASGVLESDRSIPPSTFAKIKRQFRQLFQGKQSAGEVIMLERGLKYTPVSADATKSAYKEIAELSMRRIARAFRVPLPLLGEVGATDRQAVREAQRIFDNKVMRPFLNRLQKQVSIQLTQAWGLDYYVDYEYVLPLEDKLELAEKTGHLPGLMVKEIRSQIDLKPLEELGIKDGKEIDETVLNLPGDNVDDGGFADRPMGTEAGRPPKGENTRNFPKGDEPMPKRAQARR